MPTSPRPGLSRISCNACHCEPVTDVTARGNPFPPAPRFLCLRRLPFFLRQKKGRKERRQNQGFGILFAAGASSTSVSSYLADRDVQNLYLAFVWSLRRHPLAAHAGPRCPDAAGIQSASAVLCAIFLVIVSQGPMPTSSRPGLSRISCNACHCEGAPRPWRSVSPSAAVFMSPTAPFLSAAKEREERTPPKPRFWNPFRG